MNTKQLVPMTALVLLVASALPVGADGGGTVSNRLPTVETFSAGGTEFNEGTTVTLTGTVKDRNKEGDIQQIKVESLAGPLAVSATRTVVAADVSATSEPGAFTAGWKVWNSGGTGDGVLSFKYQINFPSSGSAGAYTLRASVKDEGALQTGPATDVALTVFQKITRAADPVAADGTAQVGARWGAWTADPGAVDTSTVNYLKITNTGTTATQSFTLDFTSTSFAGVTTATETIAIDTNIRFAVWEDTSPGTSAPNEGSFTFGALSATGSVTASFTARNNIIYVAYQLASIPDPVVDQAYQSAYTVNAL